MADPKVAFTITTDTNHEGGFQKDPDDSGNWTGGKVGVGELRGTNFGISAAEFPSLDIENLTRDRAIEIYASRYWPALYSQIDDQPVANKLADMGVLFGQGTVVKILQAVLHLQDDGLFGPNTLAKVNGAEPNSLLTAFRTGLVQRAVAIGAADPLKRKEVGGWIRRINS